MSFPGFFPVWWVERGWQLRCALKNCYIVVFRSVESKFRTETNRRSLSVKWNETYVYFDVSEEEVSVL